MATSLGLFFFMIKFDVKLAKKSEFKNSNIFFPKQIHECGYILFDSKLGKHAMVKKWCFYALFAQFSMFLTLYQGTIISMY